MKIAVLSGKGGTGKTLVSVNLACSAKKAVYADCDVEEPNGQLFLKPIITNKTSVTVTIPSVDLNKCTRCRKCITFCKYNALALINDKLMIFNEVCHSCGGCIVLCPQKAFTETSRIIGSIEEGISGNVISVSGCLNTGEVSGVPIIKSIMSKLPKEEIVIIDCPPGSACVVMESIRSADFCVLVAEPTIFGTHNLAMVYDLVKFFNKPAGVLLNKCLDGQKNPSEEFCINNKINILAKIPFDEQLGSLNSQGFISVREDNKYKELFENLLTTIEKEIVQ